MSDDNQTDNESQDAMVVLSRAIDQAGDILASVHSDRLQDPTPCPDWDVATLIAHIVNAPRLFVESAKGEQPDYSAPVPPLSEDWAGDFRSAGDDLMHVWHQAGDDASPDAMRWQTAEFAVHTWDLAKATGQSTDLDPDVGQTALDFMVASLKPEQRGEQPEMGTVFGDEVSVPEDASVYSRLAAFAGRDPR